MTKHKIQVDNGGLYDVEVDLPGNSNKSKEKKEKETPKKIIRGEVKVQKKSVGKKASEIFFGETLGNVGAYILQDVLIPAAKDTLYELITGGSAVWLWGEKKSARTYRSGGQSKINYGSFSRGPLYQERPTERRQALKYNDVLNDLVFTKRGDAELALETLVILVEEYGSASVADLYERIGITGEFTDNDRGWTNLSTAKVDRVRGGYLLVLPPVVRL